MHILIRVTYPIIHEMLLIKLLQRNISLHYRYR